MNGLPRLYRFRHYVGLERSEARFASLLGDFAWSSMSDLLDRWAAPSRDAAETV